MKYAIFIIFNMVCLLNVRAQEGFEFEKLKESKIGSLKMGFLLELPVDIEAVKSSLGKPIEEEVHKGLESTSITLIYKDFELVFSDFDSPLTIGSFEVTSPEYRFFYDGLGFKVGDPISKLSQKFPKEYQERDGTQVVIHVQSRDMAMGIDYDADGSITKIVFVQSIT